MRKIVVFVALMMVLCMAGTAFAETKFGVFNFDVVVGESDAGKAAKKRLEGELMNENNALEKTNAALMKEEEDLQKQFSALSAEVREERRAALIRKRRDHEDKARAFVRKADMAELRAKQGLYAGIQSAVATYGAKNNYTMIFVGNNVLYAVKSADLTDDILQAVNALFKSSPKSFDAPK